MQENGKRKMSVPRPFSNPVGCEHCNFFISFYEEEIQTYVKTQFRKETNNFITYSMSPFKVRMKLKIHFQVQWGFHEQVENTFFTKNLTPIENH